jgi:Tol biopolymer transport system component
MARKTQKVISLIAAALSGGLLLLAQSASSPPSPALPGEKHLHNVRQLTFGGQNAEAYFSADGKQLIFQSTRPGVGCDQIFIMNLDGSDQHMVSTGKGRTTCSFFFPDGKRILYASTHAADAQCPPPPDWSKGYRWALYPGYEIFQASLDGSHLLQLTHNPGYDAEGVVSPDGKKIAFTSLRRGDLDIYIMDADGRHVTRLTREAGYDGGPFFSPDSQWIVYRAYHPQTPAETQEYRRLLGENLFHPTTLELWVMRADGSQKRQITHNGAANFAPYFFPDGKRVIFASNLGTTSGMGNFELWAVNLDGSGVERITDSEGFDGFPMFSPDGKKLVWSSQRNAKEKHEINVFLADWSE